MQQNNLDKSKTNYSNKENVGEKSKSSFFESQKSKNKKRGFKKNENNYQDKNYKFFNKTDKTKTFLKTKNSGGITGIYKQINQNYGIVTGENGIEYFIFKYDRKNAFSGDKVEILIKKEALEGKKAEAQIVNIITRGGNELIGTFILQKNKDYGFVKPYNSFGGKDIFINLRDSYGAKNDDIVSVKIISGNEKPVGIIKKIIGNIKESGILEKILLIDAGVKKEFSEEIIKNLELEKTEINSKNRLDLRGEIIYTIDGADARDLDDAVSIKILDNGSYELGVHIADVAQYVRENTPVDIEARARGTSIYLPSEVIPMLPEKLSNELCSLNTISDKATLSIIMTIDKNNGKVLSSKIQESIIKSSARLTYDEVQEIITNYEGLITNNNLTIQKGDESDSFVIPERPLGSTLGVKSGIQNFSPRHSELVSESINPELITIIDAEINSAGRNNKNSLDSKIISSLLSAHELFKIVYERRKKEGKIEFELSELKIETNNSGEVINITKRERNTAHRIIEEFMILANEEISKFFSKLKIPFLYRIHEKPGEESILSLEKLLAKHKIFLDIKNINSLVLSQIIDSLKGNLNEQLLTKEILFAMSKAKYSELSLGHFGLSLQYYSHFTSPIRRYPDLQIHRIIKEYLRKELSQKRVEHYKKILPKVALECSNKEQKAEEIERKITQIKVIEYMEKYIGKRFDGKIGGITTSGIYVELPNGVEGFIFLKNSTKNLIFNEDEKYYIDEKNGEKFTIGKEIKIIVKKADKTMGFLDFDFI